MLGDSFGAAIVEHLSKKDLEEDAHAPLDDVEMDLQGNGKRLSIGNEASGKGIEDQL